MREIRTSGSMSGDWNRTQPRRSSTLLNMDVMFKYKKGFVSGEAKPF